MQRRPVIAGNWKMHGTLASAGALVAGIAAGRDAAGPEIWVFPPYPHLAAVAGACAEAGLMVGGQDLHPAEAGAFTGAVSGAMLRDVGAELVLVGHSERRALFGDDNTTVAAKVVAALAAGLTPVLCLGETLEQRQAGVADATVLGQLDAVLAQTGPEALARMALAYEPVWAIGTGETATPEVAGAMHAVLRNHLVEVAGDVAAGVHILYGGSVKPDNAAALFAQPDIDGALVGGASLKADSFLAICRAAAG